MPLPLVGRESARRSVVGHLLDPGSSGVVICGPSGVGKSRLAEAAVTEAFAAGCDVEQVYATTSTSTVPFGALAHLAVGAPRYPTRTELLVALVDGISDRAQRASVVVFVDDAHLVDDGVAAFLHAVRARQSARLLLTVRSGADAPGSVTALWKDGRIGRVDVAPLEPEASDQLTEVCLGGPVDTATLGRLWRWSAGSPLYLLELLAAGRASGALSERWGVWRWDGPAVLGDRLTTLVGARLDGVTAHQRRLLEVVALAEPVPIRALRPWGGAAMLERLERTGVLRSSGADGPDPSVRLAHPLYGELLREALPPLARRRMLAALAEEVAGGSGSTGDEWFRLTIWRAGSGGAVDAEALVAAARRAATLFAHGLAERLARQAVDAGGGPPARLLLGRALYWLGRYADCVEVLTPLATEPTRDAGTTEVELADAANIRAAAMFWGLDDVTAAQRCLEELGPLLRDPRAAAIVASQAATLAVWSGAPAQGAALLRGAPATPTDTDGRRCPDAFDPPSFVRASIALALAAAVDGQTDAAIRLASGAVTTALAHAGEMPRAAGELLAMQASASWLGHRLTEAADLSGAANRWCIDHDEETMRGIFVLIEGQSVLGRGDIAASVRLLREAGACLQQADPGRAAAWAAAALAAALAQGGDAPAAAAAAARAGTQVRRATALLDPLVAWGRAWAAAVGVSPSAAVAMLLAAADGCAGRGVRAVEVLLLVDAARLGGARQAVPRLATLAAGLDVPVAVPAHDFARGIRDLDGALLRSASAHFARGGAALLAAEAAILASRAYAGAGSPTIAAELAERSRALLHACPGADPPTVAFMQAPLVDPLTPREREVALLAAGGLSNPVVAGRLGLSVRTVENHLARAYLKLGIQRRRDLTSVFGGRDDHEP